MGIGVINERNELAQLLSIYEAKQNYIETIRNLIFFKIFPKDNKKNLVSYNWRI